MWTTWGLGEWGLVMEEDGQIVCTMVLGTTQYKAILHYDRLENRRLTQIVFRRHSQARFVDGESVGKSFTAEAVEDDGPNFSGAFLWSPKAIFSKQCTAEFFTLRLFYGPFVSQGASSGGPRGRFRLGLPLAAREHMAMARH